MNGDDQFGYIAYSTTNIGDDIQAIAARRFLPEQAIPIDREWIGEFEHSSLPTLVSGWFMHTLQDWPLKGVPPQNSWPPAPCLEPFFVSIHLTKSFFPIVFSPEGIDYLRRMGPIGARDLSTLEELQKRNIPSYFSGCLTLTLNNEYKTRDNVIYAVDVSREIVDFIKSRTRTKVITLTHGFFSSSENNSARMRYAIHILNKYKKAKCVVTQRLHACLPCLAFETPVLFVYDTVDPNDPRLSGLIELARNCTKEELLKGDVEFDFNHPPQNPNGYRPIRENLIRIVEEWVTTHSERSR